MPKRRSVVYAKNPISSSTRGEERVFRLASSIRGAAAVTVLMLFLLLGAFSAQAIERRKDQFPTEFSYLILPLPYSLPGIGTGWFVPLSFSNLFDTTTDVFALAILGDATGTMAGIEQIPVIDETLFLNFSYQDINKAMVNNYDKRGMDTGKDDYSLLEVSQADSLASQIILSFWERRIEFFASRYSSEFQLDRLRDSDGNIIAEFSPPYTDSSKTDTVGFRIDYTDDFQDPRAGLRFLLTRAHTPSDDPDSADFYTVDAALTGYIPIGEISTLALHFFRSDATVTRRGNDDLAALIVEWKAQLGCGGAPACDQEATELATSFYNANIHGTSTSLGGDLRMRAYPGSRFQGAHTFYFSAEFRWNLSEEVTPFDYYIWKDVRTGVQVALFYELGSVSETSGTLGDDTRSDVGAGFRLVAGSGEVYRADIAVGDEGGNVVIIIDYPF